MYSHREISSVYLNVLPKNLIWVFLLKIIRCNINMSYYFIFLWSFMNNENRRRCDRQIYVFITISIFIIKNTLYNRIPTWKSEGSLYFWNCVAQIFFIIITLPFNIENTHINRKLKRSVFLVVSCIKWMYPGCAFNYVYDKILFYIWN